MPLHIPTGLLIFASASLILGFMIAAAHKADDARPPSQRASRSLLRTCADALFFWISDDFRYPVAYPWLILALIVAVAYLAPYSWPAQVYHCDGDAWRCLGIYDSWRA
ncbi:hypothetical protein M2323_000732 [Rhodoblastus acidophilus]|uniref:hypothetical protein n=1 Tax=Rhodoblastus acidophilus TaxID=1074 RepID=UPI0022251ABE|nr:hypothetical protein [Rhodoblastus acidophilus]MCW2283121.1 hypothetical protein [Rhodoblastus acidophilus]MCW2331828.1 hypothetical protein [Rhodoblastus acidophilus]